MLREGLSLRSASADCFPAHTVSYLYCPGLLAHAFCSWEVLMCVGLLVCPHVCHGLASANGMLHVCVCVSTETANFNTH